MITSSAPATHSPRRRHPDPRPISPAAAARLLTAEAAPVYRCADAGVHLSTAGSRRTAVPMPLGAYRCADDGWWRDELDRNSFLDETTPCTRFVTT